ncbi:unnamed protein product, partial [marine sediment metagenome]
MDRDLKIIYGSWIFVVVSLFITIQLIPLTFATLVLGTNSGFVTEAPDGDPGGFAGTIDAMSAVGKDTSPANAGKIIEIGWYCDGVSQGSNFEVGLYAADGAVVPGEAGTRLYRDPENAKGTTAGWKRVTVDWEIDPDTDYWLGLQVDNTATITYMNWYI